MMEITPISQEDFDEVYGSGRHTLARTLKKLEVGAGFRTPCIWHHYIPVRKTKTKDEAGGTCYGGVGARQVMRRAGKRLQSSCRDKVLYVIRVE